MASHSLTDSNEVEAALNHPDLSPPPPSANLGDGSMFDLRTAMARFSHGDAHSKPRKQAEDLIAEIDPAELGRIFCERANRLVGLACGSEPPESSRPAWETVSHLAVESLATALGIGEADLELTTVVADVELVVRSIGRGEAVGDQGDAACDRLSALFVDKGIDPVAGISILYQVFDAIVALSKSVAQSGSDEERPSALAGTVRVAQAKTVLAGHQIERDEQIALAFGSSSLEFGAGPHHCPGQELAWALVDALAGSALKIE